MKRLVLFLLFCASLASAQLAIRNPGFLASLQPAIAAGTWSSNNMTLWLVAEDLSGVANNAAPLLWTNRIGSRMSFTNTTGTAVIKSNSVVNSKAALFFDGTSGTLASINTAAGGLTTTNWNAFVANNQCMLFFVIRQRAAKAQNTILQWNSTDIIHLYATYDDVLYFDYKDQTGNRISGAQPGGWDDTWHVVTCYRDTSGNAAIRVDGANIVTGTMPDALATAAEIPWLIGSSDGGFFQGDIAEVRMFNVYTAGEIALNEQDLDSTYTP